ncbi:Sir2 family NAD-dependent protein deacetylase, partial [Nocardia sp. JCM 34519.1]|uniref:Sir2 family NAD-dependent protein deacetylase n=2 Tax=unclassified Nocardia TaxID=2637762 RepID=UPI00272E1C86
GKAEEEPIPGLYRRRRQRGQAASWTVEAPDGTSTQGLEVAPDADAVVADTTGFVMVDCARCGGMLKSDIVYFGENVPKDRVADAYAVVESADALLVAGSSLTVLSGLRFVRHAAKLGHPVVIVNRGRTRGDELAALTMHAGCSPMLTALADRLSARFEIPA